MMLENMKQKKLFLFRFYKCEYREKIGNFVDIVENVAEVAASSDYVRKSKSRRRIYGVECTGFKED